jgi:cyclopropane-fatty-acyl-phospholipid synthase
MRQRRAMRIEVAHLDYVGAEDSVIGWEGRVRPMGLPAEFFRLYLDSEMNHSSGYFEGSRTSLDRAQRAKIEAILARCELEPSMRLLDVGCGWGAAVRVAATEYGVHSIGISIDNNAHAYAMERKASELPTGNMEFQLKKWEDFTESVDRIICINSFENFDRKLEFLAHCRKLLPTAGRLVILTVTADRPIFRVISKDAIIEGARRAGFDVDVSGSLATHYARTLEHFVANLDLRRREALRFASEHDVDRMRSFYSRSAELLRSGVNDMFEFTLVAR